MIRMEVGCSNLQIRKTTPYYIIVLSISFPLPYTTPMSPDYILLEHAPAPTETPKGSKKWNPLIIPGIFNVVMEPFWGGFHLLDPLGGLGSQSPTRPSEGPSNPWADHRPSHQGSARCRPGWGGLGFRL